MKIETKYNIGDIIYYPEPYFSDVPCPICEGSGEIEYIKGDYTKEILCPCCEGDKVQDHSIISHIYTKKGKIREIVITEDGMNYKINHSFLPFHEDSIFLTSEEALRYGKTIWKIELEEGEIQNDNTSN